MTATVQHPHSDFHGMLPSLFAGGIKGLLPEHACATEPVFSITILAGSEIAMGHALRLVSLIGQKIGSETAVQVREWSFDELYRLRPGAISDELADQTDILIIATHHQRDLPVAIRKWVACWLNKGRECALVCLVGSGRDRCPVWPATVNLRKACEHAGVSFFATSFHSDATSDGSQASEPQNSIPAHFSLNGVSHWGINE